MKRTALIIMFAICAGMLLAQGQVDTADVSAYPSKPIQIVVPANPGGDTDMTARFIAKEMEKLLGVSMPVVNMAGAAGTLATNDVKSSPADGYKTIYFHTDIIVSHLLGMNPNKWDETFEIAGIPSYVEDFALFVHADAPFDTLDELIAYAKESSNKKLVFATDTGSINQVLGRVLQQMAGIQFIEVDGGNASDRVASLKGKQADLVLLPYSVAKDYVENGDFICLGIMANERNEFIPEVSTFSEQGFDITYTKFFFFGFRKGTDKAIIDKFSQAMEEATTHEDYRKNMSRYNMVPKFIDSDEAVAFMREQEEKYQMYVDMMLGD